MSCVDGPIDYQLLWDAKLTPDTVEGDFMWIRICSLKVTGCIMINERFYIDFLKYKNLELKGGKLHVSHKADIDKKNKNRQKQRR